MFIIISLILLFLCFVFFVRERKFIGRLERAYKEVGSLVEENNNISKVCDSLQKELYELKLLAENRAEEIKKIVYQKKSSEVRTGKIAEQMAPFLVGFPYSPKNAVFLGNPIDFVVFDTDGIHFIEVKSGKSQLNKSQRRIRDLIRSNSVSFEIYRIKGD